MLPAEHHQSSSVTTTTMAFIGRSVLSLRRNQVASVDRYHEDELQDLNLFQSHVADCLLSLSPPDYYQQQGTLSFSFLHNLLDVFLSCKDQFKNLLARNPTLVAIPPNDRLLSDLLDRTVKSLDILNLVTHDIHSLRHRNRHAQISAAAIMHPPSPPGEGRLRRARRALSNLLASLEPNHHHHRHSHGQEPCKKTERTRSLLRCKSSQSLPLVRSWSVSLSSPRTAEAGSGLGLAAYTMSSVLALTMWALVAALPCHVSFLLAPVGPPRQLVWSAAFVGLQGRIGEELRRRKAGLLVEYAGVERIGREMMELVVGEDGGVVVRKAAELAEASGRLEEGLGVFERRVREVFHRVVESRAEVMRLLERNVIGSASPYIVL